jgi:hypothetical protein
VIPPIGAGQALRVGRPSAAISPGRNLFDRGNLPGRYSFHLHIPSRLTDVESSVTKPRMLPLPKPHHGVVNRAPHRLRAVPRSLAK